MQQEEHPCAPIRTLEFCFSGNLVAGLKINLTQDRSKEVKETNVIPAHRGLMEMKPK